VIYVITRKDMGHT